MKPYFIFLLFFFFKAGGAGDYRELILDAHVLGQDFRMRDEDGVWSATATESVSVRFTAGNSSCH